MLIVMQEYSSHPYDHVDDCSGIPSPGVLWDWPNATVALSFYNLHGDIFKNFLNLAGGPTLLKPCNCKKKMLILLSISWMYWQISQSISQNPFQDDVVTPKEHIWWNSMLGINKLQAAENAIDQQQKAILQAASSGKQRPVVIL